MSSELDGIPKRGARRRLSLVALVAFGLLLVLIGVLLAAGRVVGSA